MTDGAAPLAIGATPVLTTHRLRLCRHEVADLEPAAAMWNDPAIVRHIGGRPFSREEVWHRIQRYAGHWCLVGFGYWAIRHAGTDEFLGEIGFADARREAFPALHGLPECGWALSNAAQGCGYASEALAAVLDWSDRRGTGQTVCLIDPANNRSIRLAERFGYHAPASNIGHGTGPGIYYRSPDRPPLVHGRARRRLA